jgi:hypothetical protein
LQPLPEVRFSNTVDKNTKSAICEWTKLKRVGIRAYLLLDGLDGAIKGGTIFRNGLSEQPQLFLSVLDIFLSILAKSARWKWSMLALN